MAYLLLGKIQKWDYLEIQGTHSSDAELVVELLGLMQVSRLSEAIASGGKDR
jgi:hypothetical protein